MSQAPAFERYSLHKIEGDVPLPFDPHCYSRFKFGDESCAQRMGHELADGFAHACLEHIPKDGIAVAVCYEAVPTAAYFLRKHFIVALNEHLAARGLPLCQEAHIKRVATFFQDFGKMSAVQRANSLDKDDFYLATPVPSSKDIIYLDDVRITGAHERKMLSTLKRQQIPNNIRAVYFAELIDTNVDPTLENTLNYHAFSAPDEMARLTRCRHFVLTARFTKHILSQSGEAFSAFLKLQETWFLKALFHAALADRWDQTPRFSETIARLAKLLDDPVEEVLQGRGNGVPLESADLPTTPAPSTALALESTH